MIPYEQARGYRRSKANEDRARSAARLQSQAAQAALAVLTAHGGGQRLSQTPVWRRHWIDVLRRRAVDDTSTLGGLAAGMSPPMTKDAFAGQLRRACRFAEALVAGGVVDVRIVDETEPASLQLLRRPESGFDIEQVGVDSRSSVTDEVRREDLS